MLFRQRLNQMGPARRRRQAIAAVELAMVIPVLALMAMGMFELSRGMMARQILTGAARKGCRTGIVQGFGNQDIINDAVNVMQDNGFGTTQFNPNTVGYITITVTDPNGNILTDAMNAPSGSEISVRVAIPTTSVNWVSYIFLTKAMMESDLVVMMKQ